MVAGDAVFQVFWANISSVSSGFYIYYNCYIRMLQEYVSRICFRCFRRMFQVFYLHVVEVFLDVA
jgi:hypothetical protein